MSTAKARQASAGNRAKSPSRQASAEAASTGATAAGSVRGRAAAIQMDRGEGAEELVMVTGKMSRKYQGINIQVLPSEAGHLLAGAVRSASKLAAYAENSFQKNTLMSHVECGARLRIQCFGGANGANLGQTFKPATCDGLFTPSRVWFFC